MNGATLRASRATELADAFPSHVASAWLGHTEAIADAHYRQVTEEHFVKAVTTDAKLTKDLCVTETGTAHSGNGVQ